MRRTNSTMRVAPGSKIDGSGWCTFTLADAKNGCACRWHIEGEGNFHAGRNRVDFLYPGDTDGLPEGWRVVGYIPGLPGGDTYFVQGPDVSIRSACLRRITDYSGRRCMQPAGRGSGRTSGNCSSHGGSALGNGTNRLLNLMDPNHLSYLRTTMQPAMVSPALQQLKTRIDLLRDGWYLFIGAIIERRKWLETADNPDRMVGIGVILAAANTIIDGTAIQGDIQANQFKATAKVWASQAYCMRLARLLVEIALEEGEDVGRSVAKEVEIAMVKRGMIANEASHIYSSSPAEVLSFGDKDVWALAPKLTPTIVLHSQEEVDLLGAMTSEDKQLTYAFVAEQLGENMLSLYPLMGILHDLRVGEEHANAPFSVRQKILKMEQVTQKSQLRIEKALDITFSAREEDLLGRDIGTAVVEAIQGLAPAVAQRILAGFMERKDEVELPKKGTDQRIGGSVLEAIE